MNKHKLLLLITNLGPGGAQRVFSDQSICLKEQYDVAEAVFDITEFRDLYKTGNPQFSLDTKGGSNLLDKVQKLFKRARNLAAIIKSQKTELCISHMDGANWVNVISGSGAKKILVVHGTILYDYEINKYLQVIRKKLIIPQLYKRADCVVAVSEGIRQELITFCNLKNVITIPNGFDIAGIQQKAALPLPAEWEAIFSSHPVLITSGRLHEQKNQRGLIPVFKALLQQHHNLKLVFLGDGDLRQALIQEAQQSGLSVYSAWDAQQVLSDTFHIYFAGYVDNPFQYLSRSTLFVFPSSWEGFPLALCEAIIAGVPVLSADCPTGPREILNPGTFDADYKLKDAEVTQYGVLLPMGDKETFTAVWVKAINNLLENKSLQQQMLENSLERIKEFDKSVIVQKWFSVIKQVLQNQPIVNK